LFGGPGLSAGATGAAPLFGVPAISAAATAAPGLFGGLGLSAGGGAAPLFGMSATAATAAPGLFGGAAPPVSMPGIGATPLSGGAASVAGAAPFGGIIGGTIGLPHVQPPDPMALKHQLEQAYQQGATQRQQLVLQLQDLQQQFLNMANTQILREQHLYPGNPSGLQLRYQQLQAVFQQEAAQSATVLQLQQLIKAADDKLLQLGVQLSQMVQHNGNTAHPASSMTGNSDTDLKLARLQSVTRYECSRNLADAERDILLEHERKRAKLLYDATL